MTVKEVFDLRKQGRIEEAYEAIRPMYAVHQGKYTTLCMFWTASDVLKKRIREQRLAEAEKIFRALLRVLPRIEDSDGRALSAILYQAVALDREYPAFCILDFLEQLDVARLCARDWQDVPQPAVDGQQPRPLPSVARQLLDRAFVEIQASPMVDQALKVMPLLQEAVWHHPQDRDNRRYMSVVYRIMGDEEKAREYER